MSYLPYRYIEQPDGTLLRVSLRDTENNATPVAVDGSGATQPISAAALPLPAGASTSALQTTGNATLVSIDGKLPTLVGSRVPVLSLPYGYAISKGLITGVTAWSKFGFNPDVDNSQEDIWEIGGAYAPPPAGGIQMQVVSSSASDDGSPAGTGVQTVMLYYLDPALAECTEEVTLNGIGAVNTSASDIFRLNDVVATAVGTGGAAAGNIDVQAVGGGVTYARISAGYTAARHLFYTVPAGKTLYITEAHLAAGVAAAGNWVRFIARATYDRLAGAIRDFFLPYSEEVSQGGPIEMNCAVLPRFSAGVDFKFSAVGDSASTNGACSVVLFGWLEE